MLSNQCIYVDSSEKIIATRSDFWYFSKMNDSRNDIYCSIIIVFKRLFSSMIEFVISYRNNRLQIQILQWSYMWKIVTVLRNNVSLFYFFNYFWSIEFSWENLSYLLCAFSSSSSTSALSLRKSLLFSECFLSY